MKLSFVSLLVSLLLAVSAQATDYMVDSDCKIFLISAKNISAERGNFLSARVAVAKTLLTEDYKVRLEGFDQVSNSRIEAKGDYMIVIFDYFAKGIETVGQAVLIQPYLSFSDERLYDINETAILKQENNWNFQASRCAL